jgi:hypothetical protein
MTAKRKFNLLLLGVRRRREMKLDDDDVVRTIVSQGRVAVTLCIEEMFLCISICSSPSISDR